MDYTGLYTSSRPRNRYGEPFNNVLRFKDLDAARQSVEALDALHQQFRATGDRRGQYHAQHIALLGMHRSAGLGKH